jgi:hypothetical protein
MEPHLFDIARMGEIAAMMFDKDEGPLIFATTHLHEMLQEFRWLHRDGLPAMRHRRRSIGRRADSGWQHM